MTDLDQELEGVGGTVAVCSKDLKRYFYLIGVVALLVLFGALVYRQSSGEGLKLDQLLARLGHVKTAATPAHGASPAPLASTVAGVGWVAPPSSAAGIATLPPIAGFGPPRQEAAGSATFSHVALAMRNSVASVSASSGGQTAPDPVAAIGAPDGLTRFATPTNRTVENIGSGVVVRNDGYIVTNYHVVRGANTVFATILDDVGSTRYSAEIVKLDEALDLALLKVVPKAPLSPAVLGDSDAVMVADEVIAIGSPFGLDMTVSRGILSAKRKSMVIEGVTHNGLLQTDAAINQGNSGGPLVAANGAVIGINTAIYTPNGAFAGIGFAVPSNQARQFVLDEIGSLPSSTVDGPSFGLVALPSQSVGVAGPPIPAGARSPHADGRQNMDCTTCHDVIRGGPVTAAPGGMTVAAANMPPPPIVAGTPSPHTDGRQNMQCNTCHQMLTKAPAGGRTVAARNQMGPPIAMGMASPHRDNRDTMACATCHQMVPAAGVAPVAAAGGAYQFAQPPASLAMNVAGGRQGAGSGVRGMVLAPMTPDVAARLGQPEGRGALVAAVAPGSPAHAAGLSAGDVVLRVDGRLIRDPGEVATMLAAPTAGRSVRLGVLHQGEAKTITMTFGPMTVAAPAGLNAMPQTPVGAVPVAPPQAVARVPTEFNWMGLEIETFQMVQPPPGTPVGVTVKGAVIAEVLAGSRAELAGLRANDVVLGVNNRPVATAADLDAAIKAVGAAQQRILIRGNRNGHEFSVVM